MQLKFAGDDGGVFVFGQRVLRHSPTANLALYFKAPDIPKGALTESQLWDLGFEAAEETRKSGEIGIFVDRQNLELMTWAKTQSATLFPCFLLKSFIEEQYSDSVEFRRLARKFIRSAKMSHMSTLFFPEMLFADTKTERILQHLAGSQTKIVTLGNALREISIPKSPTRVLDIYLPASETFIQTPSRLEKFLGTKIQTENLHYRSDDVF